MHRLVIGRTSPNSISARPPELEQAAARPPASLIPYAFPSSHNPQAVHLRPRLPVSLTWRSSRSPPRLPRGPHISPCAKFFSLLPPGPPIPAPPAESLVTQRDQRKGLEQQHPSPIPSNKISSHRLLPTGARASGSLPVHAPAGCRGRLGLPLAIATYQHQHMVPQQSCLITPVKSKSSHKLSGEVLREGEGRCKVGEGKEGGGGGRGGGGDRRGGEERRKRHRNEEGGGVRSGGG